MSKIFFDMDGVLADFDRGLLKDYGIKNCIKNYGTDWNDKTEEQKKVAESVRVVMTLPEFWRNIPLMTGAIDLWNSVHDPYILTALPGQGYDEMIISEKKNWIEKVFGIEASNRVITCLRPEKVNYAAKFYENYQIEQNTLVDDLDKNCQEWTKAGGKAILYQSAEQAINELKGNRFDVV